MSEQDKNTQASVTSFPANQSDQTGTSQTGGGQTKPLTRFIDKRWKVLSICFFVMAILGLPLIFMSPAFSTLEKWFWAIVITLYTIVLFVIVGLVCYWSYMQITSALS